MTRTPNLRIHVVCSMLLSYQGHTFAVPYFEHWLWWYRYFLNKVNIWFVNCGQQHSFSTHERMFLWKCQSFWDRKYLDLRGTRTPNLRIHAECSNFLSYQGQTFAVPCFEHMYTCLFDNVCIQDNYAYMQDIYVCMKYMYVYKQDDYVYMYTWLCLHARYLCIHVYLIMYTCKIVIQIILNYIYMHDNYLCMQYNYVYMQNIFVYMYDW